MYTSPWINLPNGIDSNLEDCEIPEIDNDDDDYDDCNDNLGSNNSVS